MAKFYPKNKPYKKGFFDTGDGHSLYYEFCGNPKGKPVVYLHGGPGAGINKASRRFFNPKKFNVLLFDQRGAGKSSPLGSMKNNNTWTLAEDIKKLLAHFGMKKVFVFGGSWGSTLALVFAIKNPEMVSGMLLRGIFLSYDGDVRYAFEGPAKELFPEQVERFLKPVPKSLRKNPFAFYAQKIASKNPATRKKFAFAYASFEQFLLSLEFNEKKAIAKTKKWNFFAGAKIESGYLAKKCFLQENFILKNAHKLSGIPVTIVHGRYDMVCSPKSALKLHKALKGSKLFFTTAGHSASDKETEARLAEEMEKSA